jgi:hypothetical protein
LGAPGRPCLIQLRVASKMKPSEISQQRVGLVRQCTPTSSLHQQTQELEDHQTDQCHEVKANGERCRAKTLTGSRWCFFHDPASAKKRTAASRRGGEKKRAVVLPPDTPDFPLNNPEDVSALMARIVNQLLRGQLDAKTSYTAGYLLNSIMRVSNLGKLEQRVSKPEAAQNEKGPTPNPNQVDYDLDALRAERDALKTPRNLPYPVDADYGAALEAVINHHVHPWEHFQSTDRYEWLQDDPDSPAGKPAADALENAMRGLIGAGEVASGKAVELVFPCEALYHLPLIEGQWVDRYMLELAEFRAAVEQLGFQFYSSFGAHSLAPSQPVKPFVIDRVTCQRIGPLVEADEGVIASVRRQIREALAKFPDRTNQIDGRIYFHIDDYRAWPGRGFEGSVPALDGIVASSWNDWVDRQGGEGQAELAGIKVRKLAAMFQRHQFTIC